MNEGAQAADQIVQEGIKLTEAAVRLSASGAKNLAALALALAKDQKKLKGHTSLKRLLLAERPPAVFSIMQNDYRQFKQEALRYGVLFAAVKDKKSPDSIDVIVRADDVALLNRIFDRLGYAISESQVQERKNAQPRARQEKDLDARGDAYHRDANEKPSIRERIAKIKIRQQHEQPEIHPPMGIQRVKQKGHKTR